jgi:uncharacterized Zn finger protein
MTEAFKRKLLNLTWDALVKWADPRSVERGKGYQSRVEDVVETPGGSIVARVHGREDYLTKISFKSNGSLESTCTCPVGYRCKHAVALVLVAARRLKDCKDIETCDPSDTFYDEIAEVFKIEGTESVVSHDIVLEYLEQLKGKAVEDLLKELLANVPGVRPYLRHKFEVMHASNADFVRMAKKAIKKATSGYYDHWDRHGGHNKVPDYGEVEECFTKLKEAGDWKSLRDLGFELLEKGQRQIECSNDEEEIYCQVIACMRIVVAAMDVSPLPAYEKAMWMLEYEKRDHFSLVSETGANFMDKERLTPEEWSRVADHLMVEFKERLRDGEEDSYDMGQEQMKIANALENAGREDEVVDLMVSALKKTHRYESLVNLLLRLGRRDEAIDWCRRGIVDCMKEFPGISDALRDKMRTFAEERGDHLIVAAYDALKFLAQPDLSEYERMRKSCMKVKKWEKVRELSLKYLETGCRPDGKRGWPLPDTGDPVDRGWEKNFPDEQLLIEIALFEKRFVDAVRWFKGCLGRDCSYWDTYRFPEQGWEVAKTVADELPEEAIAIWKIAIERNCRNAAYYAYDAIVSALRAMRPVMERLGRRSEWDGIVSNLREEYKRRKNFVKMLDGLNTRRKSTDNSSQRLIVE